MPNYQKSKNDAFHSMISQKISQKIDSLPQIDCVSQRWIWELIQNAKDAGSQFDKIKIKIDIYDNKMVFSHNGNPFSIQNIESLAFHFSAKQEENREDVETTGKYGTGFMVTYVISKTVKLKCKLKGFPDEDSEEEGNQQMKLDANEQENKGPSDKDPNVKQQEQVGNKATPLKKQKIKEQKVQKKKMAEIGYHQDLQLTLDRNYTDIKELKDKISKLDRSIQRQLKNAKQINDYVRTQESFDTVFTYEGLDNTAFSHIKLGLVSLRRMFPLTLLFNEKLYSVEVNNYSINTQGISSFEIVRENDIKNPMKLGLQQIFTAAIYDYQNGKTEGKKTKTQEQYLFQTNQKNQSHSIIAFPVKIVEDKIHLLRFQQKFPKIFKQFPLIGCQDTGFNFAFTSKEFYPSETRKQLLLKQFEGRHGIKAEKNWEILHQIFRQVLDMYVLLAPKIEKGKFNLFFVAEANQFTKPIHQKQKMKTIFDKLRNFIFKAPIFQNNQGTKSSYQDLQIIYDTNSQLSQQAYDLFAFLLKTTLTKDEYKQFCEIVQIQAIRSRLYNNKPFLAIQQCVEKLSQVKFQDLVAFLHDQKNALLRLQKIYKFLVLNRKYLLYNKYIILTQDLKFKCFNYNTQMQMSNLHIQIEFQHKKEYFNIATQLRLPFRESLIHKQFNPIFEKQYEQAQQIKFQDPVYYLGQQNRVKMLLSIKFQEFDVMNEINTYFLTRQKVKLESPIYNIDLCFTTNDVIMLGRYLSSFEYVPKKQIAQAEITKASLFKQFRNIKMPLCESKIILKLKEGIYLNQALEAIFKEDIDKRTILSYKSSKTISDFAKFFVGDSKELAFQFVKDLLSIPFSNLEYIPNADQQIVKDIARQLKVVKQGYDILNQQDYKIYNRFYQKCSNKFATQLKPLEKSLVHPRVIPAANSPFKAVTFSQLFTCIKAYYYMEKTDPIDKEAILNYTFHIYEEYFVRNNAGIQSKFEAFKEIINARHLEFGKLLNSLSDKDKDFICKVFKMKDEFETLDEIISNYNMEETLAILKRVHSNQPRK